MPSEHADLTGGLPDQPYDELQQRGLAGAVRADQGHDPSGWNTQRAVSQCPGAPVPLGETACLYGVHEAITPFPSRAPIVKGAGDQRGDPLLVQTRLRWLRRATAPARV